jgi:NAD(P)H dehydrogenase (quinone)
MKKLIVTANPSSQGFTHKITNELVRLSNEHGDITEVLDLYKTELRQDFLVYENKKEIGKDSVTKSIQEKIAWADELIFIFPIWWSDVPAIMKNFLDCNFTAGFAYKYDTNGKQK